MAARRVMNSCVALIRDRGLAGLYWLENVVTNKGDDKSGFAFERYWNKLDKDEKEVCELPL